MAERLGVETPDWRVLRNAVLYHGPRLEGIVKVQDYWSRCRTYRGLIYELCNKMKNVAADANLMASLKKDYQGTEEPLSWRS